MGKRLPVPLASDPLEEYALCLDELLGAYIQCWSLRRYPDRILLLAECNKTLMSLANAERCRCAAGVRPRTAVDLSEARWNPKATDARRIELLLADLRAAANEGGGLFIDEHRDRKWKENVGNAQKVSRPTPED